MKTRKEIMTAAHQIAKTFEGNYSARFAEALRISWKNAKEVKTTIPSYKISDSKIGMFATVNLPEGVFNLTLKPHKGINNRKEWTVIGSYPTEKWSISYEGGKLFILAKGGDFFVGQKINHKAFGKGVITNINGGTVGINFNESGEKAMAKSILTNFIK
jgi:hypothetical protein